MPEPPGATTGGPLAASGRPRAILTYPDPALRRVCAPAAGLGPGRLAELAADLLATMYHAGGRGLAAPQIGKPWRVFVMDHGWKAGTPCPRVVADPEILPLGPQVEAFEEGCLSIPGRPVIVTRPARISLRGLSPAGEPLALALSGIEARIAQHEADHLDGRLILDFLKT